MADQEVDKTFRVPPEYDARLPELIQFAYLAGFTKKPTFQAYMIFALNCAEDILKKEFLKGKK